MKRRNGKTQTNNQSQLVQNHTDILRHLDTMKMLFKFTNLLINKKKKNVLSL